MAVDGYDSLGGTFERLSVVQQNTGINHDHSTTAWSSLNLEVVDLLRFPQLLTLVSTEDRLLIRDRGRVEDACVADSSSSQDIRSSPVPMSRGPCRALANENEAERSVQAVLPGRDPVAEWGVSGNDEEET